MSNEIIPSVVYDNYDDFQHINVLFSQNFISLFLGLFNDKTDPRVKVVQAKTCGIAFDLYIDKGTKFVQERMNAKNKKGGVVPTLDIALRTIRMYNYQLWSLRHMSTTFIRCHLWKGIEDLESET